MFVEFTAQVKNAAGDYEYFSHRIDLKAPVTVDYMKSTPEVYYWSQALGWAFGKCKWPRILTELRISEVGEEDLNAEK